MQSLFSLGVLPAFFFAAEAAGVAEEIAGGRGNAYLDSMINLEHQLGDKRDWGVLPQKTESKYVLAVSEENRACFASDYSSWFLGRYKQVCRPITCSFTFGTGKRPTVTEALAYARDWFQKKAVNNSGTALSAAILREACLDAMQIWKIRIDFIRNEQFEMIDKRADDLESQERDKENSLLYPYKFSRARLKGELLKDYKHDIQVDNSIFLAHQRLFISR